MQALFAGFDADGEDVFGGRQGANGVLGEGAGRIYCLIEVENDGLVRDIFAEDEAAGGVGQVL